MIKQIKKLLEKLENPKHPLIGPHLRALQVSGIWYSGIEPRPLKSKLWLYFYTITGCLFLLSQYYQYYTLGSDLSRALQDVSMTLQLSIAAVKGLSLILHDKVFKEMVYAISERELEEYAINNEKTKNVMDNYIKFSRMITYLYSLMGVVTVAWYNMSPVIKYVASSTYRNELTSGNCSYVLILNSWFPFRTDKNPGYCVSIIIHILINIGFGFIVAPYDTFICSVMLYFKGQLEILKVKCRSIFGDDEEVVCEKEAKQRLEECHRIHNFLIKYSRIFNELLSPVMFMYVLICSLMICASLAHFLQDEMESFDRMHIVQYMISLIIQLFVYCWFTHQVFYMSQTISASVYESRWWKKEYVYARRDVIILVGKLNQTINFTAGPFIKMNLPTFISVLKGVYSFYTLISPR